MTQEQCKLETIQHIDTVRKYIKIVTDALSNRATKHDSTKIESPELEIFTEHTPELEKLTYGSSEYNECLEKLDVALKHHYANNRHHPEHFVNGIDDMNLIDIVEMFCDWKASSLRQHDGNLLQSIEISAQRFGCSEQLKRIFINTANLLDESDSK